MSWSKPFNNLSPRQSNSHLLPKPEIIEENKIALAYIDCDYYSSTIQVLNFLSDKISHGTIIAFDDWDCYFADNKRGQRLAFLQWSKKIKRKYVFEEFRRMNSGGNSFIVQELKKIGTDFRG